MDTITMGLIDDYVDRYFPVMSQDILETILFNFTQELEYSDPSYQMEMIEVLQNKLIK